MENLENEFIHIHQETIRREALNTRVLKQSGIIAPHSVDRALTSLGDLLIRVGTRLKYRTYTRLITEEASTPSFLIML